MIEGRRRLDRRLTSSAVGSWTFPGSESPKDDQTYHVWEDSSSVRTDGIGAGGPCWTSASAWPIPIHRTRLGACRRLEVDRGDLTPVIQTEGPKHPGLYPLQTRTVDERPSQKRGSHQNDDENELDARSRPPCLGPCNREVCLVKPGSSRDNPLTRQGIARGGEYPGGIADSDPSGTLQHARNLP